MCGVIACATPALDTNTAVLLAKLFEQSKIRGLHACGFSYLKGGRIETMRCHSVDQLVGRLGEVCAEREGKRLLLIGHTRYSTSGDWKNLLNNQPLHIQPEEGGGIALAFNGCIHMGLREEYDAVYGKKYTTDNDGEIFCRKVLDGEDWEGFVANGSFSFAGVFLRSQGKEITVIRNKNRPLHIGLLGLGRAGSATIIASTRDILWRAGFPGEDEELEPCVAHHISA